MNSFKSQICLVCVIPLMVLILSCDSQTEKSTDTEPATGGQVSENIPEIVMNAMNTRFPDAEIQKWTKENEDESVIYDIEFKQGEQKFEADVREDGTFNNWEREIDSSDLPDAVQKAFDKQYPEAVVGEIMEISTNKEGNDQIEGYEIVLKEPDESKIEITFAPDGEILEISEATQ